ncbi:hypothetical protein HY641_03310 [Candidatus Woesearchaeota archaeon]|nr:hypothetical protein [Candidatus Woesearchaeota archaeon]
MNPPSFHAWRHHKAHHARLFFLLVLIIAAGLFLLAFGQGCAIPSDGMTISQSTTLCRGDYGLSKGVLIRGEGIVLDCSGASLKGPFVGSGILLTDSVGVQIKRCSLESWESGITVQNTVRSVVVDSTLKDNLAGITLVDAIDNRFLDIDITGDEFVKSLRSRLNAFSFIEKSVAGKAFCNGNACDRESADPCVHYDAYCSPKCTESTDRDCAPEAVPTPTQALEFYRQDLKDKALQTLAASAADPRNKARIEELFTTGHVRVKDDIDPTIRRKILDRLNLSEAQYLRARRSLNITKYAYLTRNETLFEVTVIALAPVSNLVLYEYFPERFSELSPKQEFLQFAIGSIDIGGKTKFSYTAESDALLGKLPISIPSSDSLLQTTEPADSQLPSANLPSWLSWLIAYLMTLLGFQWARFRKV